MMKECPTHSESEIDEKGRQNNEHLCLFFSRFIFIRRGGWEMTRLWMTLGLKSQNSREKS